MGLCSPKLSLPQIIDRDMNTLLHFVFQVLFSRVWRHSHFIPAPHRRDNLPRPSLASASSGNALAVPAKPCKHLPPPLQVGVWGVGGNQGGGMFVW